MKSKHCVIIGSIANGRSQRRKINLMTNLFLWSIHKTFIIKCHRTTNLKPRKVRSLNFSPTARPWARVLEMMKMMKVKSKTPTCRKKNWKTILIIILSVLSILGPSETRSWRSNWKACCRVHKYNWMKATHKWCRISIIWIHWKKWKWP